MQIPPVRPVRQDSGIDVYQMVDDGVMFEVALADQAVEVVGRLTAELDEVAKAIGTDRYLDLPDGGSPSLATQVSRMAAEVASYRKALDEVLGK